MSKPSQAMLVLSKQYQRLLREPNEYFSVGLMDEANIFNWEIMIVGPQDTLYEGGIYKAVLKFPSNYPDSPPSMRFLSPMWHPNISPEGDVCISILHHPNANTYGYEDPSQRWSPVHSVETIVMSVISMLSDPNIDSPANVDAAIQLRTDKEAYAHKVRMLAQKTLEENCDSDR